MNSQNIQICDCGLGDGFYHYDHDGTHEYNPGKTIEEATQRFFSDRDPLFYFYIKRGGKKIVLANNFTSVEKNFSLSEYGDVRAAFAHMAELSIFESRQLDLFPELCGTK